MVPLSSETSLFEVFGDPGAPFFSFEGSRGLLGGSRGGPWGETVFKMSLSGPLWGALGAELVDFGEENRDFVSHVAPEGFRSSFWSYFEFILELF